jgi:hypothetical protein
MKNLIFIILLFVSIVSKAQQTDLMYVPDQKSLVVSYNIKQVGMYVGGYYMTSFPQPYIYTTPYSIMNRAGLTYINKNNTFSIMAGAFVKNYVSGVEFTPDVWIKIYPIRMISKDKRIMDFSFGVNYSDGFRYGVGLSFPF